MTNEDMTATANHLAGGKDPFSRHIHDPYGIMTGVWSLEITDQIQFLEDWEFKGGLTDYQWFWLNLEGKSDIWKGCPEAGSS